MALDLTCPACQAPRDRQTRFCGACGARLPVLCQACGTANPVDNRFCGGCGGSLGPAPGAEPVEKDGAERRRITVLFSDLAGSTELAGRLDPEEYRARVLAYQTAAAQAIERFGGHVAQYLGDGILAYFGYPRAHEDDPIRAGLSGLGIVQAVAALGPDLGLQVRVGIHSGPVIAGAVGGGQRREQLALGPAPNAAARLQEMAAPGTVLMSDAVARLCEGFFELEGLGPRTLRGVEQPVEVFRIVRATAQKSRFEVARRRGLTPLVGRTAELGLLVERLEAARVGRGRSVLIAADAGLGKSRLVEELRLRAASGVRWVAAGGSPYHLDTPFFPVPDLLRQVFEIDTADPAPVALAAVVAGCRDLGVDAAAVPYLAAMLGLPPGAGYSPPTDSPQQALERTQAALVDLLERAATSLPLVLVVEDLHWMDASTLDLLGLAVARATALPLLLLMTARPAFQPQWESRSRVMQLTLDPLAPAEVAELIGRVAGDGRLEPGVAQELVSRSDGVPLFAEELTRTVLHAGRDDGAPIPASLEDSLRARLDQLEGAGEVVAAAAVIGREAPTSMLAAVTGLDPAALRQRLDRLVAADVLTVRGGARAQYLFRHALLREAAYGSLLSPSRIALHRKVAGALVEQFQDVVAEHPEIVAHHFHAGGQPADAVPHWEAAGKKSAGRFANVEALAHFRHGLESAAAMVDGPLRSRAELGIQTAMAPVLVVTRGYGATEVQQAYDRALELCQALGGAPELFWTLWGLAAFYQARGPIGRLLAVAGQMLKEAAGDLQLEIEAQFAVGAAHFMRGDYLQAEQVLERGVVPCRADPALASAALPHGSVPMVNLLCNQAVVAASRGDLDLAAAAAAEGLGYARRSGSPFVLASALVYNAMRAQVAGDPAGTAAAATEAMEVSAEIPFWHIWAGAELAWARGRQADPAVEVAPIREAAAALEGAGVRTVTPQLLSLAADLQRAAGERDEGLRTVERALDAADLSGAHAWDAELWRLRGELELQGDQPDVDSARSSLQRAAEIATSQGAFTFEGRARAVLERLESRMRG